MRIAVGMPSGDMICAPTALCMEQLAVHFAKTPHQYTRHGAFASVPQQNQNQIIWRAVHEQDADAVMLIDSDMTFPETVIDQLLARDVPFVGGIYRIRKPPYLIASAGPPIPRDAEGLVERDFVPSGMLLVRREVLDAVGYPWMQERYGTCPDELVGHDVGFCHAAREKGFKIYADLDLSWQISHIASIGLGLDWK